MVQSSEHQYPETSVLKDQDSVQLPSSSHSVISAADEDDPSIFDVQEEIPNRQAALISILSFFF